MTKQDEKDFLESHRRFRAAIEKLPPSGKARGHVGANLVEKTTHDIIVVSFPDGTTASQMRQKPRPSKKEVINLHFLDQPTTPDIMVLIAVIDVCGRAFIGQHGRDEKWVFENHEKAFTKILNEDGGVELTIEDIDRAYMEHSPIGISMHFVDQETQDFYTQRYEP